MAVLLAERIERPASLFDPAESGMRTPAADADAPVRECDLSGGPTLDDAIVGAWEGLAAQVVVACPLCGGALRPHTSRGATGGRCGDCRATLD